MKPIVTVVAIAAIACALYEAWDLRGAKESIAALTLDRDRLVKRVDTQESRIKALQAASPTVGKANAKVPAIPRGQFRIGPANHDALMKDPNYRKLQALAIRGKLDARYASLFKTLRLSPDKLARLKDLLVERQMATTDAADAASSQGLNMSMVGQALQNAAAVVDDEIKASIGGDAYGQYQEYQQTPSERDIVEQVRASLSYTSTPLTEEQSTQLAEALKQAVQQQPNATSTAVLADGTANRSTGISFAPDGTVSTTTPRYTVTDHALELAQGVLAPAQMQALQQIQEQQQAQQQISALAGPVQIRIGNTH